MKKLSFLAIILFFSVIGYAQQTTYDLIPGNGHGIRFWSQDNYKIHMGNSSEYKYGPVTDHSIKFNMSNHPNRGWVWGVNGSTPKAALSTSGNFQLAGSLTYGSTFNSLGTAVSSIQMAEHGWSGSHAILFNAYQNITANGPTTAYGNTRFSNNAGSHKGGAGAITFLGNGGTMAFYVSGESTGKDTDVDWGTAQMYIRRSGNVGIGVVDPAYKLDVDGSIRGEKVIADPDAWPDYVFEDEYDLKSLEEVENYIKANGHLPNIAPAETYLTNGVSLADMDVKLLEKIEELTLYTIEQDKKIKEQHQELAAQKNLIQQHDIEEARQRKINQKQAALIEELLQRVSKLENQ